MKHIDNKKCKEIIADCCRITKDELSRWSGKKLTDADLQEHYDPNNWTQVSQNTHKGIRKRIYRFKKTGLRVEAVVISRHSGYSVHVNLWAPQISPGYCSTSVFGPFEKKEK